MKYSAERKQSAESPYRFLASIRAAVIMLSASRNSALSGDVLQTVVVTLYFLNSDGALEGEKRTLEVYEGQTLAENLIAALLSGPESRELTKVIPDNFMINSVRVDDGICSVSISEESLAALPEDESAQRRILWSLSDSLYSIETVRGLRLLSNGEELTYFGLIPVETVAVRPQG